MTDATRLRAQVGTLAVLPLALVVAACGGGDSTSFVPSNTPTDGDSQTNACGALPAGVQLGGDVAAADARAETDRRVVLMGGGPENDDAMTHFLEAVNGGDVMVLRASGSTSSYWDYFRQTLQPSPKPSSVTTMRIDDPRYATQPSVICRVRSAEAIWLAGGDQWEYLGRWPDVIQAAISTLVLRNGPVGGTSAGAMSLGEFAFDARLGSVTSAEVLADPLRPEVSVSESRFPSPELFSVIVDTHFSERDREGRLLGFLARAMHNTGIERLIGLGLDERVAIVFQDDQYRVSAIGDAAAWFYQVDGVPTLLPETPLSMTGIRRFRLPAGSSGSWPPVPDSVGAEVLVIEDGVVRVVEGG